LSGSSDVVVVTVVVDIVAAVDNDSVSLLEVATLVQTDLPKGYVMLADQQDVQADLPMLPCELVVNLVDSSLLRLLWVTREDNDDGFHLS